MYSRLVRARKAVEGYPGNYTVSQEEKNVQYKAIKQLRLTEALPPSKFDDLGFNLLHWAVLCNQEEETRILIEGENKININATSQRYTQSGEIDGVMDSCGIYNITPLFIAALHGYTSIAQILLRNGADQAIACTRNGYQPGLIMPGTHYTCEYTPYQFAARRNHHEIVKLLEIKEIDRYIVAKRREMESKEISSGSNCSGLFSSSSKTDELKAAETLKTLLVRGDITKSELKALSKIHPSVKKVI